MNLAVVANGNNLMTISYDSLSERMNLRVERNYSFEDGRLSRVYLRAVSMDCLDLRGAALRAADLVAKFTETQKGLEELTDYLPNTGDWLSLRHFPLYVRIRAMEIPR